ncbi:MAG: sugar phosphate isomerase/epimerase family protein [Verrucomicrobiota bacterium JB024]|nr:sugar phosphate isomerase/epimerase family protein [Verrucomicrobiota bacterium JB024]
MSAQPLTDFSRLCIHTITHKPWSLKETTDAFAREGVPGITVWRDAVKDMTHEDAGKMIRDKGLEIVSYCRGGFFPGKTEAERAAAIADNEKCIDEAAAIGAPLIVLVVGAVPGIPLPVARQQIADGIRAVLPRAKDKGVKLAIEPLHPMYAAERSAVNSMKQANDMCEAIADDHCGVAVDVYHLWWDDMLKAEIERCAALDKLFAFHICDWRSPTEDFLLDRGLMGEGVINIREIRSWVEATGYKGYNEVEIFSNRWWKEDQDKFLAKIKDAYLQYS